MTTRKVKDGEGQEGSRQGDPQASGEADAQGSNKGSEEGTLTYVYSDVVARIIDVPGEGSRIFQPGDTIDSNIDPRYFKEAK